MNHSATDDSRIESLELRVLHGPQAGSTLPIEHGQSYTIGAADTCEVLLAGAQIEAEHVALAADDEGIQVTLLQGKVMTIDRSEVWSGQVIPLGTAIRLGRVVLTVDSVDAAWPQDEALEEPEPVAPEVEPEEPAPAGPFAPQDDQQPAAQPANRVETLRARVPSLLLGAAVTLLMGAAAAAWVTSDEGGTGAGQAVAAALPASAASAPQSPPIDLVELSRSFPEGTFKSHREPNGTWVLSGRIASEEARRRLQTAVSLMRGSPEMRVMLDGERLAAATRFTEIHRVPGQTELMVEQGNAGALRIVGATQDHESLKALLEAANTELVDHPPVTFAVLLRSELPARFEDRLRAAGLGAKFKVIHREPKLELQAVLNGNEVRVWERVFEEFTREYGSVLTVVAQVQHDRETVEVHIQTVVAGAFPYVVTTAGKRIAPGGALEGRTLLAIRDGELFFSDGLRVRYGN